MAITEADISHTKPALGIMPEKVWIETRITNLAEAILRQFEFRTRQTGELIARSMDMKLINLWAKEISKLSSSFIL